MAEHMDLFQLLLDELRITVSRLPMPVRTAGDFPDLGLRSYFYGQTAPLLDHLPEMIPAGEGAAIVYMMEDPYQCRYILSADSDTPGQCWLIGPYLVSEPTMQEITALCRKLDASKEGMRFLHNYYKMLPKLCDSNMTEALFRVEAALRYQKKGFEMIPWNMGGEIARAVETAQAAAPAQRRHLEQTYAIEHRMMECIAQGNYYGAVALFSQLQGNGLDAKTDSILRNAKNSLLVLNVLCRVAGYNGGVHPDQLDKWAREYIIQIESRTELKALALLRDAMLRKYCELARKTGGVRYNPVVQKVVDYVDGSFHTDLSLNRLARQFNISPSYLSTLFKKEVGISFTEYLLNKRLSFARELLRRTSLPINVIAAECGISDNNYFARIFKAQEGVTPAQYRAREQSAAAGLFSE